MGTSTIAVVPACRWAWYQVLSRVSSGWNGPSAVVPGWGITKIPAPGEGQPEASEALVSTGMRSSAADLPKGSARPGMSRVSCTQEPPRSVPCRETWRAGRSSSMSRVRARVSGGRRSGGSKDGAHSGCSGPGGRKKFRW